MSKHLETNPECGPFSKKELSLEEVRELAKQGNAEMREAERNPYTGAGLPDIPSNLHDVISEMYLIPDESEREQRRQELSRHIDYAIAELKARGIDWSSGRPADGLNVDIEDIESCIRHLRVERMRLAEMYQLLEEPDEPEKTEAPVSTPTTAEPKASLQTIPVPDEDQLEDLIELIRALKAPTIKAARFKMVGAKSTSEFVERHFHIQDQPARPSTKLIWVGEQKDLVWLLYCLCDCNRILPDLGEDLKGLPRWIASRFEIDGKDPINITSVTSEKSDLGKLYKHYLTAGRLALPDLTKWQQFVLKELGLMATEPISKTKSL